MAVGDRDAVRAPPWDGRRRRVPAPADGAATATETIRPAREIDAHALLEQLRKALPADEEEPEGRLDDCHPQQLWSWEWQSPCLLLLPTRVGAESIAYLDSAPWGELQAEPALAVAVLLSWERAYGAELAASWGRFAWQFEVRRPPLEIGEARRVAQEHMAVAECTLIDGAWDSIDQYAAAVVGATEWAIWNRP